MDKNKILTKDNLLFIFAAAFIGAGFTERISDYGYSDFNRKRYNMMWNEGYFGGGLTEKPNLYMQESALLAAENLNTPVLIKHNIDDGAVSFYQGLQFFRTLRRLKKPSWMLQYTGGGHGVKIGAQSEDMHLKISQFFDHFLKGKEMPAWMRGNFLE